MEIYLDDSADADDLAAFLTQAGHNLASGLPIANEIHILNHWR